MVRENWQLSCAELKQRGAYLYKSKLWSDCEFQLSDVTIKAHKLLMAMASPVFAKMLYGGNGDAPMNPVPIFDVRVEVFDLLLQYIYSDNLNIDSTENAFELYNVAKKWRLPYIAKQCMTYLSEHMSPNNVCCIYKVACDSNDTQLQKGCEKIFSERTKEVLNDASFCNADLHIVTKLFSLDLLNIDNELDLFEAAVKYAKIQNKKSDENALKRTDRSEDTEGSAPDDGPSPAKKPRTGDEESESDTHCTTNMPLDNNKPRCAETKDSPGKVSLASHGTASDSTVSRDDRPESLEGARNGLGILKYRDLVKNIRFLTLTPHEFAECRSLALLLTKSEILALSMNISSKDSPYLLPVGLSTCMVPRTQITREAREKSAAVFRSTIQNFSYSKKFESIPFYVRNTAWTLLALHQNNRKNEDVLVLGVTCFLDSEPREWLQNTKIKIKFCTHKPVPKHLHKIPLKFSEPTPEYAAWVTKINRSELLNPAYGFLDDFNTVTYKLYINTAPGLSESSDQETLRDEPTASAGKPDVSNLVLKVSKSSLPPSKESAPTLSQPPVQNSEQLRQKSPAFSQPLAVSQPRSVVSSVPASQQSSLATTKVPPSRPSPIVTPPVALSRPTSVLTHTIPSSQMVPLSSTKVPSSRPATAVTPAIPSSQSTSVVSPHVTSSRTTSASTPPVPSSRPPPVVNPPVPVAKQSPSVAPIVPSPQSSTAVTKVSSSVVTSSVCPTTTPLISKSRSSSNMTAQVTSLQPPVAATRVSALQKPLAPTLTRPSLAVTTPLISSNVTSPILSSRTVVTSPTPSSQTTLNKATSISALRSEPISPKHLLGKEQLVNASIPPSLPRQSTAGSIQPQASQMLSTPTNSRPHLGNANRSSLPLQKLSSVPRIAHHQQPFHPLSMVKGPPFQNAPTPSQYLQRSPILRIPAPPMLSTPTNSRPHLGNANRSSLPLQKLSSVPQIAHHQQPLHPRVKSLPFQNAPTPSQNLQRSPMLRITAPPMRPPSTIPVYEPSKLRPQSIVKPSCRSSLPSSRPQSPQSLGNTPSTGPNPAVFPSTYQSSRLPSMVNSPTHYLNRLLAPPYKTTLIDATDSCALANPNPVLNPPAAAFSFLQSRGNTSPPPRRSTSAGMTCLSVSSQVNTTCVESVSSPSVTTLPKSNQSPPDSNENTCLTSRLSSNQIISLSEPKSTLLTSSQSTAYTNLVSSSSIQNISAKPESAMLKSLQSTTNTILLPPVSGPITTPLSSTKSAALTRSEELSVKVFVPQSLKKLALAKVNYIQSNDMTVQPISDSMSSSLGLFNTRPLCEDNGSFAKDLMNQSFNQSQDTIILPRTLPTVTTAAVSFQPLHAVTLPWPTRPKISKTVRSTASLLSGATIQTPSDSDENMCLTSCSSSNQIISTSEPKSALLTSSQSTEDTGLVSFPSMQKISPKPESAMLISSQSTANTILLSSVSGPITTTLSSTKSAALTRNASEELFDEVFEPPSLKKLALAKVDCVFICHSKKSQTNDMSVQPVSDSMSSSLSSFNTRQLREDNGSFAKDSKNGSFKQSQDTIILPRALLMATTAAVSFQPLHAVTLPWPTRQKISKPVRSSASLLSGATNESPDSDENMCLTSCSLSNQIISSSEPKSALLTSTQSLADTTLVSSLSGPRISAFSSSDSVSSSTRAASFARAASGELFDEVFEPSSLKKLILAKVNYIFICQLKKSQSNDMTVQPISDSMSSSLGSFAKYSKNGSFKQSQDTIILPTVMTAAVTSQPLHAVTLPWPTRPKITKPITSSASLLSTTTQISHSIADTTSLTLQSMLTSENILKRPDQKQLSPENEFETEAGVFKIIKNKPASQYDKKLSQTSLVKLTISELNNFFICVRDNKSHKNKKK